MARLLRDSTAAGLVVALDPETGGELPSGGDRDDRPAFVLATEGEATDGHILRAFWDTSRAVDQGGPGIPILWRHDDGVLLGQWQSFAMHDVGRGEKDLVTRAYFDPEDPDAQHRKGQVKRGILNAASVGWDAGEVTRRGDLPADDPHYRAPEDDECGLPAEGLVMGSAANPNRAMEGSLCAVPADARAIVVERSHQRGAVALDRAVRGEGRVDVDALLALLAGDPRVRAWARRIVTAEVEAAVRRHASPSPRGERRITELLRG